MVERLVLRNYYYVLAFQDALSALRNAYQGPFTYHRRE